MPWFTLLYHLIYGVEFESSTKSKILMLSSGVTA